MKRLIIILMFFFITTTASAGNKSWYTEEEKEKYIEVCRYTINLDDINYVGKYYNETLLEIGFNGGSINIPCSSKTERDKEFERIIYLLKNKDVS